MAVKHSSSDQRAPYTGPIPGHVTEICRLARSHGMNIKLCVDGKDIVVVINGTEDVFRAAGFVKQGFRFPVRHRYVWDGLFSIQLDRIAADIFSGEMRWEAPTRVTAVTNGVEEIAYRDEAGYYDRINRRGLWGEPQAVERAAGLTPGRLAKPKRGTTKYGGWAGPRKWSVAYLPSGHVLYLDEETQPSRSVSEVDGCADGCAKDKRDAALRALDSGLESGPVSYEHLFATVYIGTREDLLHAGICREDQIPVAPKRVARGYVVLRGEEVDCRVERLRGGRFELSVGKPTAEIRAAREAEREPPRREKKRGPEYESPVAYHAYAQEWVAKGINIVRNFTRGLCERSVHGETTLLYDQDTIDAVEELLGEIADAVRCGSVRWTKAVSTRRTQIANAKGDTTFQSFLNHVAGAGKSGQAVG